MVFMWVRNLSPVISLWVRHHWVWTSVPDIGDVCIIQSQLLYHIGMFQIDRNSVSCSLLLISKLTANCKLRPLPRPPQSAASCRLSARHILKKAFLQAHLSKTTRILMIYKGMHILSPLGMPGTLLDCGGLVGTNPEKGAMGY